MVQILYPNATRRSLAASAPLSDEDIGARHLKHIAEITKNLGPLQSEDLNYEQKRWLKFRMARPFPEPYTVWAKRRRQRLREGRGLED